jgi:hypothetical protein
MTMHEVKHVLCISLKTEGDDLIFREIQYIYFKTITEIPLHEVGQLSLHTFV